MNTFNQKKQYSSTQSQFFIQKRKNIRSRVGHEELGKDEEDGIDLDVDTVRHGNLASQHHNVKNDGHETFQIEGRKKKNPH